MDQFLVLFIAICTSVSLLALISLGLAIIFGMMRVINFAHGEFIMLGGYATVLSANHGVNIWTAILVVAPVIPHMGASYVARAFVTVISGGSGIARAVIRSRRLLLLDELTEGVQPSAVEEIADHLRSMHEQTGMSMMIVDQDLAFVASLATRGYVMQKGQMVREIASSELSDANVLGGFGTGSSEALV